MWGSRKHPQMGDKTHTLLHTCTARETQLGTNPGPTSPNNLQQRSVYLESLLVPKMLINHSLCLQLLKWVIPSKWRWSVPLPRVAYCCHNNSKSGLEKGRIHEFSMTHTHTFAEWLWSLAQKQNPRWGREAGHSPCLSEDHSPACLEPAMPGIRWQSAALWDHTEPINIISLDFNKVLNGSHLSSPWETWKIRPSEKVLLSRMLGKFVVPFSSPQNHSWH